MRVIPVPQATDNYAHLVVDEASGKAGVVDYAEADSVLRTASSACASASAFAFALIRLRQAKAKAEAEAQAKERAGDRGRTGDVQLGTERRRVSRSLRKSK